MRIERLRWTRYRIPFRDRYSTSRAEMGFREGFVVRLITDAGTVGLGEISPLPEPGRNAVDEASALLDRVGPALIGREPQHAAETVDYTSADAEETPPWGRTALAAVRAGLDIAVSDLLARAAGVSVARLMSSDSQGTVEVNALVSAPGLSDACEAAAAAVAEGYRSVKLKVGMAGRIDRERDRVKAVRETLGPDVRLRVDANGAWNPDDAIRVIEALQPYVLEFVEQPVEPGGLEALRRVRQAVQTPIAADEDIVDVQAARRVLDEGAAQILVVKPMVVGGLGPAREIAALAQDAGASTVVTTTIDAGVGTAAALHLAATLPPGGPACGLATSGLLEADLLTRPLSISRGRMSLPDGPGLGVELDEEQMRRYVRSEGEVA